MTKQLGLMPQNLTQAMELSKMLSKSNIVPKDYQGKPENILVAIQWGAEIGMLPLNAMQSIAVINGRPSLWGDNLLGLVQSHPKYRGHREWIENGVAYCEVLREGSPPHVSSFSKAQAEAAGLWGRNTWKSYPERMLQMRARGFALRDQFADALSGLITREEAEDYPTEKSDVDIEAVEHGITITQEPEKGRMEELLELISIASTMDELKALYAEAETEGYLDEVKEALTVRKNELKEEK